MKKLQVYLVIVLCVFFTSCDNPKNSTKELEEIFTEDEIKDLNILVDYFESKFDNVSIEKKYENVILAMATYDKTKFDISKYNLNDLEKVYSEIDASIFNEIWRFGGFHFNKTHSDSIKILGPRNDGKYLKFLKEVGVNNLKVDGYAEELLNWGEFGKFTDVFFEYDYENKKVNILGDFKDYNNRVIITIHTLTNLDRWYRVEEFEKKENKE